MTIAPPLPLASTLAEIEPEPELKTPVVLTEMMFPTKDPVSIEGPAFCILIAAAPAFILPVEIRPDVGTPALTVPSNAPALKFGMNPIEGTDELMVTSPSLLAPVVVMLPVTTP